MGDKSTEETAIRSSNKETSISVININQPISVMD